MHATQTEENKERICKNCLYLKYPDNFPAALHRVYDCLKGKWNDSIRGINPNNSHGPFSGPRSPKLDYTCVEYSPDLRNHAIPDKEKIHAQNRQRELERDEWNRSKHSDDFKKRRRRRTRRKYSIEHLRGEPSFMKRNISDDGSVSTPRGLEALEDLLPPGSICLGIFEEETWNASEWRTEIHFYLVKSDEPNFLWDLCGINWDDNWGRYNWELYSRISNIKDPYMAGFLLVENLFDSWNKNTRVNPYRIFLSSILDESGSRSESSDFSAVIGGKPNKYGFEYTSVAKLQAELELSAQRKKDLLETLAPRSEEFNKKRDALMEIGNLWWENNDLLNKQKKSDEDRNRMNEVNQFLQEFMAKDDKEFTIDDAIQVAQVDRLSKRIDQLQRGMKR